MGKLNHRPIIRNQPRTAARRPGGHIGREKAGEHIMNWECFQLKNGIQLVTGENPECAETCVGFYFPKGAAEGDNDLCALWLTLLVNRLMQKPQVWTSSIHWDFAAITAKSTERSGWQLAEDFVSCMCSTDWSREEVERACQETAKKSATQSGSQKPDNFQQYIYDEYWKGSCYSLPLSEKTEWDDGFSAGQVRKFQEHLTGGGSFICVLTGSFSQEDVRRVQKALSGMTFTKAGKKSKKSLPEEFGNRKKRAEWMVDTQETYAQVEISFDIPREIRLLPASVFCSFLGAGPATFSDGVQAYVLDVQNLHCYLEKHDAGSRMVISYMISPEELVTSLRQCFASLSFLKKGISCEQTKELIQFWMEKRQLIWNQPELLNWNMGVYFCTAQDDFRLYVKEKHPVLVKEIQQAGGKIFRPCNMSVGVACQPGSIKRKKLQKVLLEGRILLQETAEPAPKEEDQESTGKKILHQFIRDCQEELDAFLSEGKETDLSAYQIWKRFQCYVRYRNKKDAHYTFSNVQEFLLGHGYSRDDVKKLKKRKDREKLEEGFKKQERPEDDMEQMVQWFMQDTASRIRFLLQGTPSAEQAGTAVKRCNRCMRWLGRSERGEDAVRAVLGDANISIAALTDSLASATDNKATPAEGKSAKETKAKSGKDEKNVRQKDSGKHS